MVWYIIEGADAGRFLLSSTVFIKYNMICLVFIAVNYITEVEGPGIFVIFKQVINCYFSSACLSVSPPSQTKEQVELGVPHSEIQVELD